MCQNGPSGGYAAANAIAWAMSRCVDEFPHGCEVAFGPTLAATWVRLYERSAYTNAKWHFREGNHPTCRARVTVVPRMDRPVLTKLIAAILPLEQEARALATAFVSATGGPPSPDLMDRLERLRAASNNLHLAHVQTAEGGLYSTETADCVQQAGPYGGIVRDVEAELLRDCFRQGYRCELVSYATNLGWASFNGRGDYQCRGFAAVLRLKGFWASTIPQVSASGGR